MNYTTFRNKVKKYPFFHSNIFVHLTDNIGLLRRQVSDWVKKGYVIQLKRGFYTLGEENRQTGFSKYFLANNLYRPSYVSLESALSYYHFIPERVHTITSISSKKTQKFENPLGSFTYHHIKTKLYGGFVSKKDEFGNKFLIATPEKAISDFFYYQGRLLNEFDETIFDTSFRLQNLDLLSKKKLSVIADQFNQKKHSQLVELFIKQMKK